MISAGHSASQYVRKERVLDAKRSTPEIRHCNSQPEKSHLFIHLQKKQKFQVIFSSQLLITRGSTYPSLLFPHPEPHGQRVKGEVQGAQANVTPRKACLMSKEVETQSSNKLPSVPHLWITRVVWVCSRESHIQRSLESVVGNLHRCTTAPCYITCFLIWFVMVLVDQLPCMCLFSQKVHRCQQGEVVLIFRE